MDLLDLVVVQFAKVDLNLALERAARSIDRRGNVQGEARRSPSDDELHLLSVVNGYSRYDASKIPLPAVIYLESLSIADIQHKADPPSDQVVVPCGQPATHLAFMSLHRHEP